jgi:hypothetical protein
MLFRPTADQRLDAIQAMLATWNGEADRFRAVASAARKGEQPASTVVAAAEEAHDGLIGLLDDMDRALETLPNGHPQFSALLQAQTSAVALLESVGQSLDVLSQFTSSAVPEPQRISHSPLLRAAE